MASVANIHVGRIEDNIQSIENKDCIFTMAVLVHIHPSSEWMFSEIAKRAKTLIVIEAEKDATWRHFARDYKKIFEGLGMRQLEEIQCNEVLELIGRPIADLCCPCLSAVIKERSVYKAKRRASDQNKTVLDFEALPPCFYFFSDRFGPIFKVSDKIARHGASSRVICQLEP